MLKLYIEAINAKDTKQLEQVANRTVNYYLDKTKQLRTTFKSSSGNSIFITTFESHGIILNILKPPRSFTIVEAFYYSLAAPYFMPNQTSPESYIRTISAFFFSSYPWSQIFRPIFHISGIPYRYHSTFLVSFLSLYQVIAIKSSHGMKLFGLSQLFEITYETFIVALIHIQIRNLIVYLKNKKNLSFLPTSFLSIFFCSLISPFIQRLTRFGLSNTLSWIFESIAHQIAKFQSKPPELPENCVVPQILICPICQEFLKDPVELTGNFFCRVCLNRWLKRSMTNPYTGEAVSGEMVSNSIVMFSITQRYRRLAYHENLHSNQ